jgi:hypothetical protein
LPQLAASGHDGSEGLTRRIVRVALAFAAFAEADRNAKPPDRSGNVATVCSRCLLFIKRSNIDDLPRTSAYRSVAIVSAFGLLRRVFQDHGPSISWFPAV